MAAERSYPKSEARGVAERSYHTFKVRGSGRECQAATAQEQPRGAIPGPRSGVAAGRSYPLPRARRWGGGEIPLVQGKEQWLRFAGAAMKRYPTPKVRETQVRR